jgi:hypothetical protein
MKSNFGKQPAGDECANYAHHDIAEKAKSAAFNKRSCEPAGNRADDEPNQKCFCWHLLLSLSVQATQSAQANCMTRAVPKKNTRASKPARQF